MSFDAEVFLELLQSVSVKLQTPKDLAYRFREESLAMKLAGERIFPCHVNVGRIDETTVLWVNLGERCDNWSINETSDIPEIIEVSERQSCGAQIASGIVYVVVGNSEDHWPVQPFLLDHIYEIVRGKFTYNIRFDWSNREISILSTIGYHEWSIYPFPDKPTPCPQLQGMVHPTNEGQIVGYSFQHVVDSVNSVKLLRCVPKNIFDVLNRAAKLCIWGYQDWEFFTMSQHYSVMSIETSVSTMYAHYLKSPVKIELEPRRRGRSNSVAEIVELSEVSSYGVFQAQEYYLERDKRVPYEVVRVNGEPLRELRHRDQNRSILHLFKQLEIIAPGEALDLNYLLWKRNYLSHPHGTYTEMMGEALYLLHEVVTLINRTWMRFLHPDKMMWENAWQDAPSWARGTKM